MKKILLLFIFFAFIHLNGLSQNIILKQSSSATPEYFIPDINKIPTINITESEEFNGWNLEKTPCFGCPSFYWQIIRSKEAILSENGKSYFYYYINFFSNSYYRDGKIASTILSEISINAKGGIKIDIDYLLIEKKYPVLGTWFRSTDGDLKFSISYKEIKVF